MRDSLIYVHYEPLAHMFLTAGIGAADILEAHPAPLRHLLLLPPIDEDEFIDPHTGFNELSGEEAVTTFLRGKEARTRNWLDYKHGSYLRELTPTEIAELLYLGHAKTHIQPPFYYKLQNNMVHLPLRNGMVTLYFRQLAQFSSTLASAVVRHLRLAANDQPFWLRLRQQHFPPLTPEVVGQLYPLLEDGILFDFSRGIFSQGSVTIPLLALADRFVPDRLPDPAGVTQRGDLVLDREAGTWQLALHEQ
ncbi:hypothetical protein [Lacticaseibacillus mingshuiensis]|uniref:ATP-dependent helicase n=1 Tax=Lacticaseibacillus mingshuiensis TaxID=2799574 RepID=A0ABW4CMQ8_9LACO|nr:hypothetical protein [Lacticaseibacillus mingshuiensis]